MVLGKNHNKIQQAKTIWKEPIKFKIRVSIYSGLSGKNATLVLVLHGKRRKKLHIMYFKS